jgi:hypothetical protein
MVGLFAALRSIYMANFEYDVHLVQWRVGVTSHDARSWP